MGNKTTNISEKAAKHGFEPQADLTDSARNIADTEEETKQNDFPNIESITDAYAKLTLWDGTDYDLPAFIATSVANDSDKITGTSAEYHNLVSEYARKGSYRYATEVAKAGAKKYGKNVDLLADIVKFGSQCQDKDACERAHDRLNSIDKKMWTWRAFTFVIDYLENVMEMSNKDGDTRETEEQIKDEILKLIEEYKKLEDERAWVAEAELYVKYGEREKAINVLKDGVEKVTVAPQCCIKLSDMLLESGDYEEVVKYSSMGIRGTAQDQPSASNGYLLYASALAKDALIHREALESGGETKNKGYNNLSAVRDALTDYRIAKTLLNEQIYRDNIRQREIILKAKSGLDSDDKEMESNKLQEILQMLSESSHDNN